MAQLQTPSNSPDNQMEALKQYGSYIVTAILVALAGYFGWTYWQDHHARVDTVAADQYADIQRLNDEVSLASQNPDLEAEAQKSLADSQAKLNKDIDALVATHGKSVYAWQALMIKARHQVDADDFKGAMATLKQAQSIDLQDAGLKAITELRYARVQLASGDIEGALSTLSQTMPGAFEPSKQELLGDVYVAKNDKKAATQAYTNAWELLRKRQENRSVLAVKLDSLGISVDPIEGSDSLVQAPPAQVVEAPSDEVVEIAGDNEPSDDSNDAESAEVAN